MRRAVLALPAGGLALSGRRARRIRHAAALWLLLIARAGAGEPRLLGPALTVFQENDLVVETDRHYTQGLKLVYLAGETPAAADAVAARLARAMPAGDVDLEAARWGLGVGQLIFTPANKRSRAVVADDRPYAGYLFAALMLQRRGRTHAGFAMLDGLEMDLGVIGPESLAEEAQSTVHRLRSFPLARGWDNQLDTEPGAALRLERRGRATLGATDGLAAQLLPHAGASLGNVGTFASLGVLGRAGWRLPADFGAGTIDALIPASGGRPRNAAAPFGAYLFAELEGRAVGYDAFLDGNLFRESHSVSKEPLVGDLRFGAALGVRGLVLAYTQVIRSREFDHQHGADAFGSLSATLAW